MAKAMLGLRDEVFSVTGRCFPGTSLGHYSKAIDDEGLDEGFVGVE